MLMEPNISYVVEALFYNKTNLNKLEFLIEGGNLTDAVCNFKKVFNEEQPIVARSNAFSFFQSIIDVLYEGLGCEYTTDYQARKDLQCYFNSGSRVELFSRKGSDKIVISDDIFTGIFLSMVTNASSESRLTAISVFTKTLIYSISHNENDTFSNNDISELLNGLNREASIYQRFPSLSENLNFENLYLNSETPLFKVLKTPIDWNTNLSGKLVRVK
jgi:hypothetical protein